MRKSTAPKTDEGRRAQDANRARLKRGLGFGRKRRTITDEDAEQAKRDWAARQAAAAEGPDPEA